MEHNIVNIPKEKFNFVQKNDLTHDKKLATKPRGYMADAFSRFCKNKGAIVGAIIIIILVLAAVIAPMCTPFTVKYMDANYKSCFPKNDLFVSLPFWDGCEAREDNKATFMKYYAMGLETGKNAVKNQEYSINDGFYSYRLDSVHSVGAEYYSITISQYEALQEYQNRTGIQVMYPVVAKSNRPQVKDNRKNDADYYFKTTTSKGGSKLDIVYDENGDIIPVYEYYTADFMSKYETDGYNSLRIEGEDGFINEDGEKCYYAYGLPNSTGYEVRVNYYEYYIYQHTEILKDGIKGPNFLFGTTSDGQDVFTCLFSGARFSFLFGLVVAVVNLLVGAIYGATAGYYGGKTDLIMERITDVLAAVPTMIVITLLKRHMEGSSEMLVLFIAFFATGWIGMAGTTRMQFYRYKNQEYVLAARTLGAKDRRLIFKHIFPNALGTLVTSCALVIPSMIYSETNLTYLGIINLTENNLTTVGTLIANGQNNLTTAAFIALFPAFFLALLMLSFNLFGNGLRDAFNPSLRGAE